MLKKMLISILSFCIIFSTLTFKNIKADTINTKDKKVLSTEEEVKSYANKHNIPLEYDGKKISEIILNTDNSALNKINENDIFITPRIGDICQILYPYEGYNKNRIAWSTSGTGPGKLSNTISKETSSEIFGSFSGKTEVVEATVGFRIGEKTTCTSSYSVDLAAGESARIVGYFRYKGYFVNYYTWGGLNHVGTYEVGRPIGIDFIVYK